MKKVRRTFAAANPVWKAALFSVVAMLLIVLAVFVALQPPFTSNSLITPIPEQIAADFDADQGVLLSMLTGESMRLIPGDVLVMIPGGVLEEGGTLVIEPHEPDILREAGEPGWSRPLIVNVELRDRFGQTLSDIDFASPIEICFVLQQDQWQHYRRSPSEFDIQIYDEYQIPPGWQSLPRLSYGMRHEFCGRVSHLSLIALAIKTEPPPPTDDELYEP
jgi:hypothetical protein